MEDNIKIYLAGSLFNGRELEFNIRLTDILEKNYSYEVILPQREGFDYTKKDVFEWELGKYLEPSEVREAINQMIYLLDVGIFVPKSDVIVANMDEPPDQGVDVELCLGGVMGKIIIGYRTDIRTTYGDNKFNGLHFFLGYQADVFIINKHTCLNSKVADKELEMLADKIDMAIESKWEDYANRTRYRRNLLLNNARAIFGKETNFLSTDYIKCVVDRYVRSRDKLDSVKTDII